MSAATPEDCPCCFDRLEPGVDTDRALVIAFVGGVVARDQNVPMGNALCVKHGALCRDGLGFVLEHVRGPKS